MDPEIKSLCKQLGAPDEVRSRSHTLLKIVNRRTSNSLGSSDMLKYIACIYVAYRQLDLEESDSRSRARAATDTTSAESHGQPSKYTWPKERASRLGARSKLFPKVVKRVAAICQVKFWVSALSVQHTDLTLARGSQHWILIRTTGGNFQVQESHSSHAQALWTVSEDQIDGNASDAESERKFLFAFVHCSRVFSDMPSRKG